MNFSQLERQFMNQQTKFQILPSLIGKDLRIIRTELGLTQKQFGEILNRSHYWVYEAEKVGYNGDKPVKLIFVKILKEHIADDLWESLMDKIEKQRAKVALEEENHKRRW